MLTRDIISEIDSKVLPGKFKYEYRVAKDLYPIEWALGRYRKLERNYQALCSELNAKYGIETFRTHAELEMERSLKLITRLEVQRSVWIANHCVDFFIPSLGIALEVDGSIHIKEHKMRKDTLRDKNLASIGICVMTVDNDEVEAVVSKMLFSLRHSKRKTSYQKKKTWRDVFIITLLIHKGSLTPFEGVNCDL